MIIRQVTPNQVKVELETDPTAVYLDVRTEQEFAQGHPVSAVNVPFMFLDPSTGARINQEFLSLLERIVPKSRSLFCGCKSGDRSQMAAELLFDAGYARVANVQGGFYGARDRNGLVVAPGWVEAGLPVSQAVDDENSYLGLKKKAGL